MKCRYISSKRNYHFINFQTIYDNSFQKKHKFLFSQGAWRQQEANMRIQNMLQRKRMCLHRAMVVSIPEKEPVQVSTFIFTSKSFR